MCVLPIHGDYGGMFYGRFASNRVIFGKKNRVPLRGADSEQLYQRIRIQCVSEPLADGERT
jgi:hypothetical protein